MSKKPTPMTVRTIEARMSPPMPAVARTLTSPVGPGVAEIIVHVGYESEVPPGMRGDEPFGSAWRQREFDFFTGTGFKELLRRHDVKLVSWRDVARLRPTS